MITYFLAGNIIYNLYDDGLANFLGLETLRHGTNPINYCSIRLNGGDPQKGGKATGSTQHWGDFETRNFFFLFKDSECETQPSRINELSKAVLKRFLPKIHCFTSSYNFTVRLLPSSVIRPIKFIIGLIGGIGMGLMTPILRFRFSKIDQSFHDDRDSMGPAYKTAHKIEAWRIGIFGSLITGINLDWISRAKASPLKILTGIVQLTGAIVLTSLAVNAVMLGHLTSLWFIPFTLGVLLG